MNTISNTADTTLGLPYNALFNIYTWCDKSTRNNSLFINKAWNESGKCFQLINKTLNYIPNYIRLIKSKGFFVAATGQKENIFTKLFCINIKKMRLIKAIDDSRTTIINIFAAAENLIVQYPREIKIFRCLPKKSCIRERRALSATDDSARTRVEALNDSFIILQSIVKMQSFITILDSKDGAQLECYPSTAICKIKLVADILLISRDNMVIRYSLTEKKLLEYITFNHPFMVLNMEVANDILKVLVKGLKLQVHSFPI